MVGIPLNFGNEVWFTLQNVGTPIFVGTCRKLETNLKKEKLEFSHVFCFVSIVLKERMLLRNYEF